MLDADGDGIVAINADVTLYGGSLRTTARDNRAHVSNGATVTLDGATWFMNNIHLLIGDDSYANGPGRVVLQNGATLEGPGSETIRGSSSAHPTDTGFSPSGAGARFEGSGGYWSGTVPAAPAR